MSLLVLSYWTLIDICLVLLVYLGIRKIPFVRLKYGFLALLSGTALYLNLLFCKWFTVFGDSQPLFLTRLIFASGIFIHIGFGFFATAFADKVSLWSKPVFRVVQAVLLFFLVSSVFTGMIITEVQVFPDEYPRYRATHGILYLPLLLSLASYGVCILALFFRSFRNSNYPLKKTQMKLMLITSFVAFVGMTITNGIVPAVTQKSYLSVLGGVFPLGFLFSAIYIIINGQTLNLKRKFSDLLKGDIAMHEDNQNAIGEVISVLKTVMHKGAPQIERHFTLRTVKNTTVPLVIEHQSSGRKQIRTESEVIMHSLYNSSAQLQAENQRMLLALVRAEALIEDKWLSRQIDDSKKQLLSLNSGAKETYELASSNAKEFAEHWGQEIICADPDSFRLLQKLEKRKSYRVPTIIIGEPGTGKATLCRGLHYIRTGAKPIEFSGRVHKLGDIQSAVHRVIADNQADVGILIRDWDNSDSAELRTLLMLFDNNSENIFFYLTGAKSFSNGVLDQAVSSRMSAYEFNAIPLRNRQADLQLLVHYFGAKTALRAGPELPYFSKTAVEKLSKHGWPGNIPELRDIIERSVLESSGSKIKNVELRHALPEISDSLSPLEASERNVISRYLAQNNFNKNRTRLQLGITINTLNAKMEKYGIAVR